MGEKQKRILRVVLLLIASGFFLFQGFSLLFSEQPETDEAASVREHRQNQ